MKKMKKMLSLLLVLVLALVVFSACGNGGDDAVADDPAPAVGNDADANEPAGNDGGEAPAAPEGGGLQADGSPARTDIHIAVIVPTLGHEFWNNYVSFMNMGADLLGIELTVMNAEDSSDNAANFVQDAIGMGVDGLIFTPYWDLGPFVLEETSRAGIPVIMTDCYIPGIYPQVDYDNYIAYVGPSDFESGLEMGRYLIANMEPGPDGVKVIGIVDGTPGTSVAIDRRAGIDAAIEEAGDSVRIGGEVVGMFVRDTSQEVTEAMLQGNPDITGIWAANGGTATGVINAIRTLGMTPGEDILVVGMDLNPENVDYVEQGVLLYDTGGHWLQGAFAMVLMFDYLNGFDIPPEARENTLYPMAVTQDRVADFRAAFPGGIPDYDFLEHSRVFNPDASPVPPKISF